ncbi:aryl-alcohol dehydrogenase [Desarmillaria tabescens]|uniref:Aryl-alcohol dehydrogenase n=1 Tax=Armillaria tabescens TaxID=1929756 RepID=A0AA39JYU5_ARMTA|nr:aryl-alcohol dehydrogenase [Desarmillaria tabescens]KAK0450300.1 aryl-alcohol dehydrogenase [Desarmillaria tabescens]
MSLPSTDMSYVRLGSSGLKVSKIILGCTVYGSSDWYSWVQDEEESIKQIKAAYDIGINTFDTANIYSNGQSEVVLGKAIKQHNMLREEIVVMTKVFHPVTRSMNERISGRATALADSNGYVNQYGLSRKHIFDSVKKSLDRLQLDYIDVLHCHEFDFQTPIHETMQALHDVVTAGYVRYIGISTCRAWQFLAMQNYAVDNHLTPFIAVENDYNLLYREDENELFHAMKYYGVSSLPWSTLARGAVTLPLHQQPTPPANGRTRWNDTVILRRVVMLLSRYQIHPPDPSFPIRVEEIANQRNITMTQVAVAWSISREGVCALVINASSTDKLLDAVGGLDVVLTPNEIRYLEEPYSPQKVHY